MTVETHIQQALDRVQDEQTHVAEKQSAFDAFERDVRDISVCSSNQQAGTTHTTSGGVLTAAASTVLGGGGASEDRCRAVREAFAETVRPYSIDDVDEPESLVATIQEELGDELAVALAAETSSQFTPTTKQAVLSKTTERCKELDVMGRALDAEEESLRSASDAVTEIIDWLVEVNETPLTELDFDELQARHESLAAHRTQCDRIARDRQVFLDGTTSRDASVGITHRTLVEYLYAELPIDHPVLVTSTRLDGVCADCQRVVRDHLVRRV